VATKVPYKMILITYYKSLLNVIEHVLVSNNIDNIDKINNTNK